MQTLIDCHRAPKRREHFLGDRCENNTALIKFRFESDEGGHLLLDAEQLFRPLAQRATANRRWPYPIIKLAFSDR